MSDEKVTHSQYFDEDGQVEIGGFRLTIAEDPPGTDHWFYLITESLQDGEKATRFSGEAHDGKDAAATTALALYRAEMCARSTTDLWLLIDDLK